MSRPNPLNPIAVNVKTMGVNVPADYTRVFGIVSCGDTNLASNTLKTVSKSETAELELKKDSYTEKFLKSFFTNNSAGQIKVLETKTEPNIKQYKAGDYYIDNVQAYKCLQNDAALSESDLKPSKLAEGGYWEQTSDPKNYAENDLYVNSKGETYKCLQADTAESDTNLKPSKLDNTAFWKDITSEIISQSVKILSDFIKDGAVRVYEWACPSAFYKNTDFIELVKEYADITAGQYFSIELPVDTNPAEDETFALYLKSKSFIPVYPSQNQEESSNGAVAGIKAGSLYNLSISNPLSLLQWKMVYGITPHERLSNSFTKALNDNGCTWIGSFNNNTVILGGMVGDGKNWEYYFALDTFIFTLIKDMGSMMIKGSNDPLLALPFNQYGIDLIEQKLTAISNTMAAFKVLEVFGADYDINNNAVLDKGKWKMIDYASYKANQYEDWKNGIYNGASVYASIQRFILQIVPNITVE